MILTGVNTDRSMNPVLLSQKPDTNNLSCVMTCVLPSTKWFCSLFKLISQYAAGTIYFYRVLDVFVDVPSKKFAYDKIIALL